MRPLSLVKRFSRYANSTSEHVDIEQLLYFTRLFGDLFGRPFTKVLFRVVE